MGGAGGLSLPRLFSSRKCRYYISSSKNASWEFLARAQKKKMGLSPNCFKRKEKKMFFLTWLWFLFNIKGSYCCWRLCTESYFIHKSCSFSILLPLGEAMVHFWACSRSIYVTREKVRSQNPAWCFLLPQWADTLATDWRREMGATVRESGSKNNSRLSI